MKNISIYKFLLPLSVIMLAIGAVIFFSGFLPSSNLGSITGMICGGLLFFGFIFFVVSFIDLYISRKRAIVSGQGTIPDQKSHSVFKYIGITIIVIILGFCALMFYVMSTMWG